MNEQSTKIAWGEERQIGMVEAGEMKRRKSLRTEQRGSLLYELLHDQQKPLEQRLYLQRIIHWRMSRLNKKPLRARLNYGR